MFVSRSGISLETITAASLAFVHTLLGSDHYLQFIVMARARKWTVYKTSLITILLSGIAILFLGL